MDKLKNAEMNGVRLNFCTTESWLSVRTKAKDIKCENCGNLHSICHGEIALISFDDRVNGHVCESCGKKYIGIGIKDLTSRIKDKGTIIEKIKDMKKYDVDRFRYFSLEEKKFEELEEILAACNIAKDESDRIDAIELSKEEIHIDEYLVRDYSVIQDIKHLKCVEQITPYFEEIGYDHLDCGQGYYTEDADFIIKIGFKYYNVHIDAEITSSKQDRGDRLYWVEEISNVKYHEVDKPIKRERFTEWFDPLNIIHIRELSHYIENRQWNPTFIPDNMLMNDGWYHTIIQDLAEHWMIERMSKYD